MCPIGRVKTSPHDLNRRGYVRDTSIHTKSSQTVMLDERYKVYNTLIYSYIIYKCGSHAATRMREKGIVSNT